MTPKLVSVRTKRIVATLLTNGLSCFELRWRLVHSILAYILRKYHTRYNGYQEFRSKAYSIKIQDFHLFVLRNETSPAMPQMIKKIKQKCQCSFSVSG